MRLLHYQCEDIRRVMDLALSERPGCGGGVMNNDDRLSRLIDRILEIVHAQPTEAVRVENV